MLIILAEIFHSWFLLKGDLFGIVVVRYGLHMFLSYEWLGENATFLL